VLSRALPTKKRWDVNADATGQLLHQAHPEMIRRIFASRAFHRIAEW
jgi:hypothetical protein